MSPTSSSASTASSMSPTIPSTSTASSKSPTNPSVSTASSMSPSIPSASTASSKSPTIPSASTASSMSPTSPVASTASSKSPTIPSVSNASSMSPTIPSASTAPSMNPTDCDQPPPPIKEESTEIEDPVNIEPVKPCPSYQFNFPQEYKIHLLPIPIPIQGVFGQPGVPIQPLLPMVNLNGQAFPFPQRRAPLHISSDSDSDEDQPKPVEDRLGRDERKAREMLIDQHISIKDIIHLPMDEFNERVANTEMNDEQQTECRDIRRKAKNRGLAICARKRRKAEAQNAQKRKITEDMEREALELEKELQF